MEIKPTAKHSVITRRK